MKVESAFLITEDAFFRDAIVLTLKRREISTYTLSQLYPSEHEQDAFILLKELCPDLVILDLSQFVPEKLNPEKLKLLQDVFCALSSTLFLGIESPLSQQEGEFEKNLRPFFHGFLQRPLSPTLLLEKIVELEANFSINLNKKINSNSSRESCDRGTFPH